MKFSWKKLLLLFGLFIFSLIFCNWLVPRQSHGRIYTSAAEVPFHQAALVLGTAQQAASGRPNLYYQYRLQAALDLYQQNKVQYLLLSGDNSRPDYDEPTTMKRDLIAAGVPAHAILLDYAGLRTLDSVVRARRIFGLTEALVVSQPFHVERAIFLGDYHGIRLTGLAARNVTTSSHWKVMIREVGARVVAVWDVLINRQPKFLGPPIPLPS